jgi:hypothetical protein
LQADRQFLSFDLGKAARDTDPANAGHVRSQSENVGQIHLQRVVGPFS